MDSIELKYRPTIIVNLFGAPGAGKSTGAAYIFAMLKMNGINAELVTEFAKDKVWEEAKAVFDNQAYIFGKQYFRISRCNHKVDVIINDSPLPLSIYYNSGCKNSFNKYVMDVFNSFININYLLERTKPYNSVGRFQSESESDNIGLELEEFLNKYQIGNQKISGDRNGYDFIVEDILKYLNKLGG